MRMPPAEGGRKVAPWKVWDGGNTQPLPRWLLLYSVFCFALFSLGFGYFPLAGSSPPSLIPRACSRFVVLQEGRGEADEDSRAFLPRKMQSLHFAIKKKIIFFSLNISQGYLPKKKKKSCQHFTPEGLCNIFIIKKYTSDITYRLYFFIIIFVIPSTVCLMFGPTLPVLDVDGDKPLVLSGQIVPDSSKA